MMLRSSIKRLIAAAFCAQTPLIRLEFAVVRYEFGRPYRVLSGQLPESPTSAKWFLKNASHNRLHYWPDKRWLTNIPLRDSTRLSDNGAGEHRFLEG
jgi:hypothetical protein